MPVANRWFSSNIWELPNKNRGEKEENAIVK
jgi:hypothetical protein